MKRTLPISGPNLQATPTQGSSPPFRKVSRVVSLASHDSGRRILVSPLPEDGSRQSSIHLATFGAFSPDAWPESTRATHAILFEL